MKKIRFCLLVFLWGWAFSQENKPQYSLDVNYYYGSILPHSEKIRHLIKQHPEGVFASFSRKTFGDKEWESRLNYPDYGITLHYQNNKNRVLGDMYGIFGHMDFYFMQRSLQLRVGQGVAWNTNPYDKNHNYRNTAFSQHLMPATFLMFNFQKENIWEGFGIRTGIFLIHHSNGLMKSPNTSANTVGANIGIRYDFDAKTERKYIPRATEDSVYYKAPWHYSFAFRWGIHESHVIGSGQYPFYVLSAMADKQISRTSIFQCGIDIFWSMMMKHEIRMMSISFPELEISEKTDYRRIGAFVGYELIIDRLRAEGQLGAYVYDDYKAHTLLYQRVGLKYYLNKNIFVGTGLKTHFSKAEAMEFSLGVRL